MKPLIPSLLPKVPKAAKAAKAHNIASAPTKSHKRTRRIMIHQGRIVSAVLLLLCFIGISLSAPLHHSLPVDETTRTPASDSPLLSSSASAPPDTDRVSLPLTNQHALLQVQVSISCSCSALIQRPTTVSSSSTVDPALFLHRQNLKDDILAALNEDDTQWSIMITEVPRPDVTEVAESSLHLNQAIDLTWSSSSSQDDLDMENGVSFYKGDAFLSFLIPLSQGTASSERTLIVSLMMEPSVESRKAQEGIRHSRIATRRLANLPSASSSSSSATTMTNNKRNKVRSMNPVVSVELSTTMTTCGHVKKGIESGRDRTSTNGINYKAAFIGSSVFLIMGGIAFYVYSRKWHQWTTNDTMILRQQCLRSQQQQAQPAANDEYDQVSIQPPSRQRRRAVVIESPESSVDGIHRTSQEDSSTVLVLHEEEEEPQSQNDETGFSRNAPNNDRDADDVAAAPPGVPQECDSSCASRTRSSRTIKPPSLVRIPYSFVAEQQEGGDDPSNLSVDDSNEQERMVDGGSDQAAVCSRPVIDVKSSGGGADYEAKDAEIPNKALGEFLMAEAQVGAQRDRLAAAADNDDVNPVVDVAGQQHQLGLSPSDDIEVKVSLTAGEEADQQSAASHETGDDMHFTAIESHATPKILRDAFVNKSNDLADPQSKNQSLLELKTLQQPICVKAEVSKEVEVVEVETGSKAADSINRRMLDFADDKLCPITAVNKGASIEEVINSKDATGVLLHSGDEAGSHKSARDSSNIENEISLQTSSCRDHVEMHNESQSTDVANGSNEIEAEPLSSTAKSRALPVAEKNSMQESATFNDAEQASAATLEQQETQTLASKVLEVEHIPFDASNWLVRLRNGPDAIPSSSEAPTSSAIQAKGQGKKSARIQDDELSYVSTLPPDSESIYDFPVESSSAPDEGHSDVAAKENAIETASVSVMPSENGSLPTKRKRRLGVLKNRNSDDNQDNNKAENMHVRSVDNGPSQKQESNVSEQPPTEPTKESVGTRSLSEAASSSRPKKSPPDTKPSIVPEVVPSTFLQSFVANQIDAPVPWDFATSSSRPDGKKGNKRSKGSRRRKRKGPSSTIVIVDGSPLLATCPHSVVSRGSSKVTRTKSREAIKGVTMASNAVGKKRRLKK